MAEVLGGELAQAIVTEPVQERRLDVETLLDEALVGVVPGGGAASRRPGVPRHAPHPGARLRAAPGRQPAAHRGGARGPRRRGLHLPVAVEVEGIRLIGDLVAAGAGCSVLPETAVPTELLGVHTVPLAGLPPRRLALVSARDFALSLADRAVRESVRGLVAERPVAINPVLAPDALARTVR